MIKFKWIISFFCDSIYLNLAAKKVVMIAKEVNNQSYWIINRLFFIKTMISDNVFVQEDTIFVSQMNPDVTETEISDHFGSIGIIKVSFNTI